MEEIFIYIIERERERERYRDREIDRDREREREAKYHSLTPSDERMTKGWQLQVASCNLSNHSLSHSLC